MAARWTEGSRNAARPSASPDWIASDAAKRLLKLVKPPATYGYEHPLWTCSRIRQGYRPALNLARFLSSRCGGAEAAKAQVVESLNGVRWNKILKRVLDGSRPNGGQASGRKQRLVLFFEDESVVRLTPTVGEPGHRWARLR